MEEARKEAINRFQHLCEDAPIEDRMKRYDAIAHVYDQDSEVLKWAGPEIAAEAVKHKFPQSRNIQILDVCAGTGAVAVELKKLGYDQVDFLDGSTEMAKIAMQRNLYVRYFVQIMDDHGETALKEGFYDAVIMSGGHVTPGKCTEMLRLTKTDRFCFLVVFLEGENDEKEYQETLAHIRDLGHSGKCQLMSADRIDQISLDENGKPVPGALVIWRKL